MAYSPSDDRRPQSAAFLRAWFSPARWTPADTLAAAAGPVLAVALFLPWFKATVTIGDPGVTGTLFDPPGTMSGLAAHRYLALPAAIALLETGVAVAALRSDGI